MLPMRKMAWYHLALTLHVHDGIWHFWGSWQFFDFSEYSFPPPSSFFIAVVAASVGAVWQVLSLDEGGLELVVVGTRVPLIISVLVFAFPCHVTLTGGARNGRNEK